MNIIKMYFSTKNKKLLLSLCIFSVFLLFFSGVHHAHAATMYTLSSVPSASIGQEFSVDIKIDTNDASSTINAVQATLQFPTNVVSALSVDTQNSTFGFWLEEPTISDKDGTIQFIGGTTRGVAGASLQIVRIKFKAISGGIANLKIVNAAATAADGKGTNVLLGTRGALITVGTGALPPPVSVQATSTEQPVQVNRVAIEAKVLPIAPIVRIPLYPDASRWYNRIGDVIVLWDLPADVTQVSASINRTKTSGLGVPEKILSNGKNFGILQEGIWYVKVQFKSSVGWGAPTYRKISIDTTVPVSFDIKINNTVSDNPSPTIQFETSDSLSGIADYTIGVDGKELITTTSTTAKLPPQPPGKHLLIVKANDLAGNSVQDSIEFEILPLPTPEIQFITKSVSQGEFVFANGTGTLGGFVEVNIVDENNLEVFHGTTPVGSDKRWDITIKEPLAIGQYKLSAISHNEIGAVSFASNAQIFNVRAKSIISIGFVELSWFDILLVVILSVITGASLLSRAYILKQQKRGKYSIVFSRDVEKLSNLLSENIENLANLSSVKNAMHDPELAYFIDKMRENVAKIRKYIKQELEELI